MRKRALALLLLSMGATGQAQSPVTPRAVADSFFAATRAERWASAAAYLDMEAFAHLLRERVTAARTALPEPALTVEQLMAQDSTLPRAVAEWQVANSRRFNDMRPFHDFSDEYAGVTSFGALQALTPVEGAVRWLEANDPDARWRRAIAALKCPQAIPDSLRHASPFAQTVLAVAEVNDSTAYVLTTFAAFMAPGEGELVAPPSAVLLRRRAGAWRVVPSPWLLTGSGGVVWGSPQCAPTSERR